MGSTADNLDNVRLTDNLNLNGDNVNVGAAATQNVNVNATTQVHFETPSVTATIGTVFPDYVFQNQYNAETRIKPEYKLMSLSEVEEFTKKNYHLPGIDSAKEVEENGLDFLKIIPAQLEKIEELFLHTIAQEKKINIQDERIKTQDTEIKNLEGEVAELKSLVKQLLEEK